MLLSRGSDLPLYVQVKHYIRSQIAAGVWKPGDALPGERELVAKLGLSRTTIRQALGDLVAEGLLYRHHGKGTFVAPHGAKQNLTPLADLPEELWSLGYTPQVEVLQRETSAPPPAVAATLGISPQETVVFLIRRILGDGEPVAVVRTYLHRAVGDLVLQGGLESETIYSTLERFGYPVHEGLQTIGATRVGPGDAPLLQVAAGSPALLLQRVTFVDPDTPVEYSEAVYRPDRFQYQTTLKRAATAW